MRYVQGLQGEYERYAESNPDYIDAPFLSNHDQNCIAGLLKGNVPQLKLAAASFNCGRSAVYILWRGNRYDGSETGRTSPDADDAK